MENEQIGGKIEQGEIKLNLTDEQKRFRVAGIVVFSVAIFSLFFRVVAYYVYNYLIYGNVSGAMSELLLQLVFSAPVQLLGCLFIPLFILKAYQKKSVTGVLADSNFVRCDKRIYALSVPLAIGQLLVATGISVLWLTILINFGYNYTPSSTEFSENFNAGYFIASMFFVAVLPAICEEFAIRGTFLTAIKNTISTPKKVLVVMAITFGLFHQNIVQLAYTAFFGGLMAYVVIKTKSIYPAMLIHFINNGLSVLFEYGNHYGFIKNIYPGYFVANFGLVGVLFTLALGGGIIAITLYAINHYTKGNEFKPLKQIFKPKLNDCAFYIGAIVTTILSTIFTLMFGF